MNRTDRSKIIIALSGGVDSAVAALQLIREGHQVEALHMTNWEDDDGYCTAAADLQDARTVCRELKIPLHPVNFAREYREQVFNHFLNAYQSGRTPNPDVLCNREIKFGVFLDYAMRLGGKAIATGHYARIGAGDRPRLLKGIDPGKDQSYFLHAINGNALTRTHFPIGGMTKSEVRAQANAAGLPIFDKPDSTGICFIGERPFREFLSQFLNAEPGDIESDDGQVVGRHEGLIYYTLGQRQGLGIGGFSDRSPEPWYVCGKDQLRNVLQVVQGHEHPALLASGLIATNLHWIRDEPAQLNSGGTFRCTVKTRYRQADAACTAVYDAPDTLRLHFDEPQWAVTPGQYAVLYQAEECLGGGAIEQALTLKAPQTDSAAATA
jgi:tRNA-specific 2-thiouridylase